MSVPAVSRVNLGCFSFTVSKRELEKVTCVALATFAYQSLTTYWSPADILFSTFYMGALTLAAEKLGQSVFFSCTWSTPVSAQSYREIAFTALKVQCILALTMVSLGFVSTPAVAYFLSSAGMRMMAIRITKHVCEEIFYRGFVMERVQQVVTFVNDHICTMELQTQRKAVLHIQAFLYASNKVSHIQDDATYVASLILTHMYGYFAGDMKLTDGSMKAPVAYSVIYDCLGFVRQMAIGR